MQTRFFIICQATVASICAAMLIARLSVGSFPVDNVVGVAVDAAVFLGSGGVALLGAVRRRRSRHATDDPDAARHNRTAVGGASVTVPAPRTDTAGSPATASRW